MIKLILLGTLVANVILVSIASSTCTATCEDNEFCNTCPPRKCDAEYCPKTRDSPQTCVSPKNCGKPRCTCNFNHKRDWETGKCIPIADCPPFECCGPNEEYQSCPPICPGQNCTDYINKTTCPKYKIGIVVPCAPKCRCKDGYYRNSKNICIEASECERASCKGDPNAEPGCGQNCGRRCSNYMKKNVACPDICEVDGCDCKEGYVYDDNTRKCVRPEDCTKTCYGPNEKYEPCPKTCPPQTCESLKKDATYNCPLQPAVCIGQCICKPGFYRNKLNTCISEENCRKCLGPNEYFACGGACDNVCATLDQQSQDNCPIINITCNNMCYCDKGYARNDKGVCIPIEDCPRKCQ